MAQIETHALACGPTVNPVYHIIKAYVADGDNATLVNRATGFIIANVHMWSSPFFLAPTNTIHEEKKRKQKRKEQRTGNRTAHPCLLNVAYTHDNGYALTAVSLIISYSTTANQNEKSTFYRTLLTHQSK